MKPVAGAPKASGHGPSPLNRPDQERRRSDRASGLQRAWGKLLEAVAVPHLAGSSSAHGGRTSHRTSLQGTRLLGQRAGYSGYPDEAGQTNHHEAETASAAPSPVRHTQPHVVPTCLSRSDVAVPHAREACSSAHGTAQPLAETAGATFDASVLTTGQGSTGRWKLPSRSSGRPSPPGKADKWRVLWRTPARRQQPKKPCSAFGLCRRRMSFWPGRWNSPSS